MTLRELLADHYHEGMTIEEVESALKDVNLADLSKGQYISKEKYDRAVKDLNEKSSAYDELVGKTKDYDELVKFKTDTETQAKTEQLKGSLKEAGFKDEYLEYALYLVDQGKIKNDDKLVDNAKLFLTEHEIYGNGKQTTPPNPTDPQNGSTTVTTTMNNGNSGNEGGYVPPKIGSHHSWNKNSI